MKDGQQTQNSVHKFKKIHRRANKLKDVYELDQEE